MNDMTHLTDVELEGLLDGTLPLDLQTVLINHLDACETCRQNLSEYTDSVAGLNAPQVHPDYRDSLAGEIHAAAEGMRATNLEVSAISESRLTRVKSIGSGGFGQVFEYRDLQFNRSVAVKLLQDRWISNAEVVRRFRREMELTAEIDHPGCPAVYGSGKTEDGRDFFWMQLVTGDSLSSLIQKAHQSGVFTLRRGDNQLRQLLTAFVQICDAIQASHDKGLLHRDLKPSNIRQHANHYPVVLDWGLAAREGSKDVNALTSSSVTQSADLTRVGDHMGSIAYMSPEAASGEVNKICKGSDVYALGGVLYAILSGAGPHQSLLHNQEDLSTVFLAIKSGHIPSFRGLPDELASICRKALAPSLVDRYASAQALASDVEQWLAGEPVTSHHYGVTGLTALAVRRRPVTTVVGVISAALVALVSLLGYNWQREAAKQRAIAENRFGLGLKAWQTLVTGVQDNLSMTGGTGEIRKRLIQQSTEGIKLLLVDAETRTGAELVVIQAGLELAHIRRKENGEISEAREDYRRLKVQLEQLAESHDVPERYKLLGDAIKGFRECTESIEGVAATDALLGEFAKNAKSFLDRFPNVPTAVLGGAQAEVLSGRKAHEEGRLSEALEHYSEAEKRLLQLPKEILEQPKYAYELLLTRSEPADIHHESGRTDQAVNIQEEIVAEMRRICQRDPSRHNRIGLITDQTNLGKYCKKQSLEKAAAILSETMVAAEALKDSYSGDSAIEKLVRGVSIDLASTYRRLGRANDAIELMKRSIESIRLDLERDDLDTLDDLAICWLILGNTYKVANQLVAAGESYRECIKIRNAIRSRNHRDSQNQVELLRVAINWANCVEPGQPPIADSLNEICNSFGDEQRAELREAGHLFGLGLLYQSLGEHLLGEARLSNSAAEAANALLAFKHSLELIKESGGTTESMLQKLANQLDETEALLTKLQP